MFQCLKKCSTAGSTHLYANVASSGSEVFLYCCKHRPSGESRGKRAVSYPLSYPINRNEFIRNNYSETPEEDWLKWWGESEGKYASTNVSSKRLANNEKEEEEEEEEEGGKFRGGAQRLKRSSGKLKKGRSVAAGSSSGRATDGANSGNGGAESLQGVEAPPPIEVGQGYYKPDDMVKLCYPSEELKEIFASHKRRQDAQGSSTSSSKTRSQNPELRKWLTTGKAPPSASCGIRMITEASEIHGNSLVGELELYFTKNLPKDTLIPWPSRSLEVSRTEALCPYEVTFRWRDITLVSRPDLRSPAPFTNDCYGPDRSKIHKHAVKLCQNLKFVIETDKDGLPYIFLKTTRDVKENESGETDYGDLYWMNWKKDSPALKSAAGVVTITLVDDEDAWGDFDDGCPLPDEDEYAYDKALSSPGREHASMNGADSDDEEELLNFSPFKDPTPATPIEDVAASVPPFSGAEKEEEESAGAAEDPNKHGEKRAVATESSENSPLKKPAIRCQSPPPSPSPEDPVESDDEVSDAITRNSATDGEEIIYLFDSDNEASHEGPQGEVIDLT
jgi:hypothetical protein